MAYSCPHKKGGVKACQNDFPSIKGWKGHLTRQHGGFSDDQLALVTGTAPIDISKGRETFLAEMGKLESPQVEAGASVSGDSNTRAGDVPSTPAPVPLKTDATAKKFKAELNRVKDQISSAIPDAINIKLKDSPEWQLTEEESSAVAESIQNCLKVLDIELAVQPIQWQFTSPFWVLIMPLLTLLIVFGKKAAKNAPEKKEEPDAEQ